MHHHHQFTAHADDHAAIVHGADDHHYLIHRDNIDHDHGSAHHHHGDDGSTLYHQHYLPVSHFHDFGGYSGTVHYDSADHNHDKPTDDLYNLSVGNSHVTTADLEPEHVHDWRRINTARDIDATLFCPDCGAFNDAADLAADSSAEA